MRVSSTRPLACCMALRGGADELGSDSREAAVGEEEILFVAPKSRWQRWDASILCPLLLPMLLRGGLTMCSSEMRGVQEGALKRCASGM